MLVGAFVLPGSSRRLASSSRSSSLFSRPTAFRATTTITTTNTRLYSGSSDREENDSLFRKMAKKVLPSALVPKSKAEKRRELDRLELQNSLDTGLSTLFKDAPLPIRLVGKLITPLLGSLVEQVQEQSRSTNQVLDEAREILRSSRRARELLGGGDDDTMIDVGPPFSQSSSSSSINGQTSSVVQASFQVSSRTSNGGTATVVARNGVIETLQLNVGGRSVNIDTFKSAGANTVYGSGSSISGGSSSSRTKFNKDDIIDAEFVEKQ